MSPDSSSGMEEQEGLLRNQPSPVSEERALDAQARPSASSISTTSLVLEHMSDDSARLRAKEALYRDGMQQDGPGKEDEEFDTEDLMAWKRGVKPADRKARRILYGLIGLGMAGWVVALFLLLAQGKGGGRKLGERPAHDPLATVTSGHGATVKLNDVLTGQWHSRTEAIRWIEGPNGEDGMLLERHPNNKPEEQGFLVVEDVMFWEESEAVQREHSTTLMVEGQFYANDRIVVVDEAWPSPDHTKVLVRSDYASNWRHSGTGLYWIFDVESQKAEPLDHDKPERRVQLASWAPDGKHIVFTRENDMFLRRVDKSTAVTAITTDGGPQTFYGVPDWVYEEEVFQTESATWWSGDGQYVAFLRTNESRVPEFPVQYYFSRPSGAEPAPGEENYPDVRRIKYPKAGAPMSVVNLQIYDLNKKEVFTVSIQDDFKDDDRLITEVLWAGETGKLLMRETNRESDVLKTILIDAESRSGQTVRERDIHALDGGWFEATQTTAFIPADPANGRPYDGYMDTVIHEGYDHLGYFTPLDNPEPKMLTLGKWEVVDAPSAVALGKNIAYFVATKEGSTQRHIYTVDITEGPHTIKAVTDTNELGYYDASFSTSGSFMLLTYEGPGIPWQRVRATPTSGSNLNVLREENKALAEKAKKTELPIEIYSTINVDGFDLNVVERRPPHFDESGRKQYPVLFFLYNGPGFQHVDRKFTIDFQSYVASALGYIVVTVDGRGTGFLGRKHRCIIRDNIGHYEAKDQIAAAKAWAAKKYVDADRLAIWGWSYGGFMTLKTLEQDAGETFKYGMAVAPVTDWRYYDSVYTERYMHTPQHNPSGYENATVSNVTAMAQNVRFLVMHGASDDNVHFQNTLALLDKLDLSGVTNYDVHVFPDSDHSIFFHKANGIVYHKLRDWLVNAFNGEWLKTDGPQPKALIG